MGKFSLKCPECGETVNVKTGLFYRREYKCTQCGRIVFVQSLVRTLKACEKCGISVVCFKTRSKCPICKKPFSEEYNSIMEYKSESKVLVREKPLFYKLKQIMPLQHEAVKLDETKDRYIYIVDGSEQKNIKWSTNTRTGLVDPLTNQYVEVGASGSLDMKISDPKTLISKMSVYNGKITTDQLFGGESCAFYSELMDIIVRQVAQFIIGNSVFELQQRMPDVANMIKKNASKHFASYGINLTAFYLTKITMPSEHATKLKACYDAHTDKLKNHTSEAEQKPNSDQSSAKIPGNNRTDSASN